MSPRAAIVGVYLWNSNVSKLGEGWRLVIAFDRKRKWLRLLGVGTLRATYIAIGEWERDRAQGRARDQISVRRGLAHHLLAHLRQMEALEVPVDGVATRRVIAGMRALRKAAA